MRGLLAMTLTLSRPGFCWYEKPRCVLPRFPASLLAGDSGQLAVLHSDYQILNNLSIRFSFLLFINSMCLIFAVFWSSSFFAPRICIIMACSKISKKSSSTKAQPTDLSTLIVKRVRLPGIQYDEVTPEDFPEYLVARSEKGARDMMSFIWYSAVLESGDCVVLTNKGPRKQQALLVPAFNGLTS